MSPIPASATVHCLMNEEEGTWNRENVQAFFDPLTANKFCSFLSLVALVWIMSAGLTQGMVLSLFCLLIS